MKIENLLKNKWLQFIVSFLSIIGGLITIGPFIPIIPIWAWISVSLLVILIVLIFLIRRIFRKTIPFNPFLYKGYISPNDFFGRKMLLRQIFEELKKGTNLSLIGDREIGKTSLLHKVCQLGKQELPEKTFIYLDMQAITNEDRFFESLCNKMGITVCRSSELEQALQGKQYVLCLDFIERMKSQLFSGNERTELRGFAEGADAPLTLLIASRFSLDTLFPEDYSRLESSPLDGICHNLDILPFGQSEVRDFIQTRLQPTGKPFTEEEIEQIWEATQGHPARVQEIAAKLYRQKFESNNTD